MPFPDGHYPNCFMGTYRIRPSSVIPRRVGIFRPVVSHRKAASASVRPRKGDVSFNVSKLKANNMTDNFDSFISNLQEKIFAETREAFGEAGFRRWRHPLYRGRLSDADAHAQVTGKCGDTMEIFLKFENDRVCDAAYVTDGCGSSTVCGSFAAEMALGKDPDQLAAITGEAILKEIGRFPEDDRHCAFLAAETIQEALSRYMTARCKKR